MRGATPLQSARPEGQGRVSAATSTDRCTKTSVTRLPRTQRAGREVQAHDQTWPATASNKDNRVDQRPHNRGPYQGGHPPAHRCLPCVNRRGEGQRQHQELHEDRVTKRTCQDPGHTASFSADFHTTNNGRGGKPGRRASSKGVQPTGSARSPMNQNNKIKSKTKRKIK